MAKMTTTVSEATKGRIEIELSERDAKALDSLSETLGVSREKMAELIFKRVCHDPLFLKRVCTNP